MANASDHNWRATRYIGRIRPTSRTYKAGQFVSDSDAEVLQEAGLGDLIERACRR